MAAGPKLKAQPPAAPGLRRAVTAVSLVGHPFLLAPLVMFVAGWRALGGAPAIRGVLTLVVACLAPASIYIGRKVRRGEWSDLDVSARRDRPHLFTLGLGLLFLTVMILWVTHQSAVFIRGSAGAMLLLAAAWVANRWLKPSMHTGFAVLTAGASWRFDLPLAISLAVLAAAVGWSRIVLARHTLLEVVVGYALGGVVAVAVF